MNLFQLFESKELVSEFLWFQRYISDHDLETQMEIEDDKIVFRAGEKLKLIKWDGTEARQIKTKVMTDALRSYRYTRDVVKMRFELVEPVIAKSASNSYWYARNVIKGRFERGESAISKDGMYSYLYARYAIKGRFELGEPAISKDAERSHDYAREVIKGRFELGELAISKDPTYSQKYQDFLKSHFISTV